MLPRKAVYMRSDVRLLSQHLQVPIHFPKDFFSVILKKGEESGIWMEHKVSAVDLAISGPERRGFVDSIK